jgi:chitin disaccharide deacetylase
MRALIVNADDLGASSGVNRGIARACDAGIVTSASLMVLGAAAGEIAGWSAARPTVSLGLHVDLAEWEYLDGAWQARYQRVDAGDEQAVRAELDRQLGAFLRLLGRPPTHLDSHQHVHRDEPVGRLLAEIGDRLGIPTRSAPTAGVVYRGDFYGQSGKGEPYWEALTLESLLAVLDNLPDGTTELGCHPGYVDDLDSTYRLEREMETRVLCEPELRRYLDAANIALIPHARTPNREG